MWSKLINQPYPNLYPVYKCVKQADKETLSWLQPSLQECVQQADRNREEFWEEVPLSAAAFQPSIIFKILLQLQKAHETLQNDRPFVFINMFILYVNVLVYMKMLAAWGYLGEGEICLFVNLTLCSL